MRASLRIHRISPAPTSITILDPTFDNQTPSCDRLWSRRVSADFGSTAEAVLPGSVQAVDILTGVLVACLTSFPVVGDADREKVLLP